MSTAPPPESDEWLAVIKGDHAPDEEVPLLDKEQLKRQRRERSREFHRGIYREMRARKRDRERREGRR